jgi:WD40 repeat protein
MVRLSQSGPALSGRAASGSEDTTLRLWRVSDGSLIAELKGHKDRLFRVVRQAGDYDEEPRRLRDRASR